MPQQRRARTPRSQHRLLEFAWTPCLRSFDTAYASTSVGSRSLDHLVLRQELANRRVDHRALLGCEVAVAAAGNGDELVRHADLAQRLVETHRVLIGHDAIGIAVNRRAGTCR